MRNGSGGTRRRAHLRRAARSRARGDARDDSDLDVLLVAGEIPSDFDARVALLWSLKRSLPHPPGVQIVLRTVVEFEHDVTPLHLDLALDARVVVALARDLLDTCLGRASCA